MTEIALVVLVIDDEIQIRRFLRAGLELDGFVMHETDTHAHTYCTICCLSVYYNKSIYQ